MSRHRRRLSRRQRGILKMKRKLALLFVVIVLLLMGIIVRLVYINRVSGEQYKKRVLAQQDTKSQTLPYKRGDIYDRNGTVLATSEKVYNLILDFEEAMDDKDSRIEGVWLEDTYIRRYPYDSLACNVIGYTVSGNVGQYGLEQQ